MFAFNLNAQGLTPTPHHGLHAILCSAFEAIARLLKPLVLDLRPRIHCILGLKRLSSEMNGQS